METACVDGHSRISVVILIDPGHIRIKVKVCVQYNIYIYDNNISPSLLMIIINIIILYFIQIRHTDDFPPTGTLLVKDNTLQLNILTGSRPLKSGYIEFAMVGNYSMRGIQLLLTRLVSYC